MTASFPSNPLRHNPLNSLDLRMLVRAKRNYRENLKRVFKSRVRFLL